MAFDVVIGGDAQADAGFDVTISGAASGPSMLDFVLPSEADGTVFLILVVRNAEVMFSDGTWTKVIDGVGASGIFLDGWARTVDGTTGINAADVISVLSMTAQELQGGLLSVDRADINSLVYEVTTSTFTTVTTLPAPSITSQALRDTAVCIWSAEGSVSLTGPAGFTEIDEYGTSVFDERSLLISASPTDVIGVFDPGDAPAGASTTGRAFTIAIYYGAPGLTLTQMQTGNVRSKWVAAIEGYENLLTDGATDAVVTAWDDTGYASAMGGLYVRPSHEQRIHPWDPFANTGGSLTLQVVTDQFGVDTHLTRGGNETYAAASVDCDDGTLTVMSASSFDSSGYLYCGTEAMAYSGSTSTSFTGLSRGQYSPFKTESGADFAHPHTITDLDPVASGTSGYPVVSSTPRSWMGKWVGLWRHLESGGLLNVKSDALCTFAGRISGIRDNPATMTTDVEVKHVLEYIRDAVLGENPWKAKIVDGITIPWVGISLPLCQLTEWTDVSSLVTSENVAAPLMIVNTAPASPYEIQAGRYEVGQVMGFINAWLGQAFDDGDIIGIYRVGHGVAADGSTHGKFSYRMTTTNGGRVRFTMQSTLHRALGTFAAFTGGQFENQTIERLITQSAFTFVELTEGLLLRNIGEAAALEEQFGEFFDQTTSLPDNLLALMPSQAGGVPFPDNVIGLGVLNDSQPILIRKEEAADGALLSVVAFNPTTGALIPNALDIPFDQRGGGKIRQVVIIRDTVANVLKRIFCSTGTASFNHTEDVYPAIIGLGIPFEILTAAFFTSVDRLAHAEQEITVVFDRPKKLIDVLGGCLKLRFAFLRWIEGHLEFYSWATPTTGDVLEEGNKASPVGAEDEQRTASNLSNEWMRNVIKIDYDRDFSIADTGDATFNSHVTIINRASIDDQGGQKATETIIDPTSFTDSFIGGSGSLEEVLGDFRSTVTLFTTPVRTSTRTIAPTMFEGLGVGDTVLVQDNFARDPDTGQRGVSTRPGIIVAHSYEPGGAEPSGSTASMHGQVEVMFLDLLRIAPYVPCANISSVAGAVLTCTAHDYSVSGETADAVTVGVPGHKVRIVERDPADPASPLQWDRIVQSQTGNTITLTAALSSPAYDAAKAYRVVWDDYPDAVAGQQAFCYEADDADFRIADSRAPYQYVANTQLKDTAVGDANAASDPIELPPDSADGDGVGLDVGHMQALNRLATNLYDYKTAASTPMLFQDEMTVSGATTNEWTVALVVPLFLGTDQLNSIVRRKLYVAPMFKSSSGTVNARITLSKSLPTGAALEATFGIPKASAEFTTTSTTYTTPTASGISFGQIKDLFGVVYLTLELQVPSGTATVSCRGIATCYEGARE